MTVPLTPPEASIPLPVSRVPSPSGPARHRLHVSDLATRRSRMRSPLRSISLPTPDDDGRKQEEQGGTVRMASHLRLDTSVSSPASVSIKGDYQLKRPFIVRSSTSTSTVYRESSSSVPPPMSSRRPDYEEMVKQEQAREENEAQDDFYKERVVKFNQPVGSLSISPSSRDLCLASRKGLYIVDVRYPEQVPRCVPQGGMWQVADCQWSPHPATSNLVLTTSAQKLLLWDLCSTSPSTCLSRVIEAHERGITDINWHARDPNYMATTSIDGSVKGWDIRVKDSDRAVMRLADWGDAATQVKWNRCHDHILASSHGNRLCVWDTRKGAVPITSFQAHDDRMYGIDWDRRSRHEIVTCSLDKTIKYWSIDDMSTDKRDRYQHKEYFPSLPAPAQPTSTIRTKNPVWRARNLPFGRGVLSVPQRGACALEMWGKDQDSGPIERFEEYTAPVKEFVWRTRGGNDPDHEDREFQLITWSKDRQLRMIPIQRDLLARAGYRRGAPIDVLVSRRNAPDVSYATWDTPPLPWLSARLRAAEESASGATTAAEPSPTVANFPSRDGLDRIIPFRTRSESLAPLFGVKPHLKLEDGGIKPVKAAVKTAVMTRGSLGRQSKKRKTIDQLEWLGGVTTIHRDGKGLSSLGNSLPTSQRTSRLASLSRKGSDSGSQSIDGLPGTPGGPLSFSFRGFMTDRRGSVQFDGEEDENLNIDLADEIRHVKVNFPRARFESQNLDFKKRQCAIYLPGPWGESARTVRIRILFRFPRGYPRKAGQAGCPVFKLIDKPTIPSATHDVMRRRLQEICEEERPALAACVSYLLGMDRRQTRTDEIEPDSGSESDDDLPTQKHVLDKVTCGMCWGPNGELITFFAKDPNAGRKRNLSAPNTPSGKTSRQISLSNSGAKGNASLLKAMSALSRLSDSKHDKHRRRQAELAGFSFAQGIHKTQLVTADELRHTQFKLNNRMLVSQQKPTSVVQIWPPTVPAQPCRRLAELYEIRGGIDAVQANRRIAKELYRTDHELIWKLCATALSEGHNSERNVSRQACNPPRFKRNGSRVRIERYPRHSTITLAQIIGEVVTSRDIQLLATMLAIFADQQPVSSSKSRAPLARSSRRLVITETDYFNSREPSRSRSEAGSIYQTPQAPSPSAAAPYLAGLSSNFSQFLPFSNSLVSSNGFGDRERRVSESPSWTADPEGRALPVPLSSNLRLANRSASPRRDSFRQQLFGKPLGSSHGSQYAASMRSATEIGSVESHSVQNSRMNRVSFGSLAPAQQSTSRIDSEGSDQCAFSSRPDSHVRSWRTVLDLASTSPQYGRWSSAWRHLCDEAGVKTAYADLLLRWGLHTTRSELMLQLPVQHSTSDERIDPAHESLTTLSICGRCNYEIRDDVDQACSCARQKPPACAFCRLPVTGIALGCTLCLHIQHASCAKLASVVSIGQSAITDTTCPMGCDCVCRLGGFNGTLEVEDTGVSNIDNAESTPLAILRPLEESTETGQPEVNLHEAAGGNEGQSTPDPVEYKASGRTLGMFKAQMRNLGEFSHYFSHAN